MQAVTPSEAAGFVVGGLLLAAALAAPKVDNYVARSQRRSLGLCEQCGGLEKMPCRKCRGCGETTDAFDLVAEFLSDKRSSRRTRCSECDGRGYFACLNCSKKKAKKPELKENRL